VKAKFASRFERGHLLGNGTFAKVYAVARCSDHREGEGSDLLEKRLNGSGLAVKVIDLNNSEAATKSVIGQEVSCWRRVGTQANCIRLHDTIIDGSRVYMIMEKCENALLGWLRKSPISSEADADRLFCDMLAGVTHVHSVGLIHRDVKPPNFLVGRNGSESSTTSTVKLCDFGLAVPSGPKQLRGVHGTAPFMSPEMVSGEGYDELTDVWSLGATAYFILYGAFPFGRLVKNSQAMKSAIKAGKPPMHERAMDCKTCKSIPHLPTQRAFRLFTAGLLQTDVKLRPSAKAAWRNRLEAVALSKTHSPVHSSTTVPSCSSSYSAADGYDCQESRQMWQSEIGTAFI